MENIVRLNAQAKVARIIFVTSSDLGSFRFNKHMKYKINLAFYFLPFATIATS